MIWLCLFIIKDFIRIFTLDKDVQWNWRNTLPAFPPMIIGRPLSRQYIHYYTRVRYPQDYYFVLLDAQDFAMHISEDDEFQTNI